MCLDFKVCLLTIYESLLNDNSSPESTVLALQILLTISSCEQGGLAVLRSDDLASLLEVASEQTMALDVLSAAVLTASSQLEQDRDLQEMLAEIMSRLVVSFRGTDSVTLLQFVAGLFPRLSTEVSFATLQHDIISC